MRLRFSFSTSPSFWLLSCPSGRGLSLLRPAPSFTEPYKRSWRPDFLGLCELLKEQCQAWGLEEGQPRGAPQLLVRPWSLLLLAGRQRWKQSPWQGA